MAPTDPEPSHACPICFETIAETFHIHPCDHCVCQRCLMSCIRTTSKCCICRQIIRSITPRPEPTVAFDVGANEHVGIVMTNDRGGKGVVVDRVDRRDLAYENGIRKGDVITHINGITTTDHRVAVSIIQACTECSENIEIVKFSRGTPTHDPMAMPLLAAVDRRVVGHEYVWRPSRQFWR